LREATSVSRLYEEAWASIITASLSGRQALASQLGATATAAQASAIEATSKRDLLRDELAALQEPYRDYQVELAGRKKREVEAEKIRMRAAALAAQEHAEEEAKAAAQREKSWRASGNTGLSPDGRQACQQHFMTYASLKNASQAVAMTQGVDAAADFVIKEAMDRGISQECLQYLTTQ
jgi:predicted ATP-grasp superfamily ATP-dependent carboligase